MGNQAIRELREQESGDPKSQTKAKEDPREGRQSPIRTRLYITPSPGAYGFGRRKRGKVALYCRENNTVFYTAFSKDMRVRELKAVLSEDLQIPREEFILTVNGEELTREFHPRTLGQLSINEMSMIRISTSDTRYLDRIKNRKRSASSSSSVVSTSNFERSNYPSIGDMISRSSGGRPSLQAYRSGLSATTTLQGNGFSRANSISTRVSSSISPSFTSQHRPRSLMGSTVQIRSHDGSSSVRTTEERTESVFSTIQVPMEGHVNGPVSLRGSELWKVSLDTRSKITSRLRAKKKVDLSSRTESWEDLASESTESTVANVVRQHASKSGFLSTTADTMSAKMAHVSVSQSSPLRRRQNLTSLRWNDRRDGDEGPSRSVLGMTNPWKVNLAKYRLNDDRAIVVSNGHLSESTLR